MNNILEIETNEKLIVELFDKQGERKFVKTKLDTIANTFLSDKNTYVLGYYAPPQQSKLIPYFIFTFLSFLMESVLIIDEEEQV